MQHARQELERERERRGQAPPPRPQPGLKTSKSRLQRHTESSSSRHAALLWGAEAAAGPVLDARPYHTEGRQLFNLSLLRTNVEDLAKDRNLYYRPGGGSSGAEAGGAGGAGFSGTLRKVGGCLSGPGLSRVRRYGSRGGRTGGGGDALVALGGPCGQPGVHAPPGWLCGAVW